MVARSFLFVVPCLLIGCRDSPTPTYDQTYSFTGTVVDSATSSPITGVRVGLRNPAVPDSVLFHDDSVLFSIPNAILASSTSGTDGSFRFDFFLAVRDTSRYAYYVAYKPGYDIWRGDEKRFPIFQVDPNTDRIEIRLRQTPAIRLAVGDRYYFWYWYTVGTIGVDGGESKEILADTTIGQQRYWVFSSGEILRTSPTIVYRWRGSADALYYRFDVHVGDTTVFDSHQVRVVSIAESTLFGGTRTVIAVSNSALPHDTIYEATFTRKYGVLHTMKSFGDQTWSKNLQAVSFDSIIYLCGPGSRGLPRQRLKLGD